MSWTRSPMKTADSTASETTPATRAHSRNTAQARQRILPMPSHNREALMKLYRQRDEEDARRHESGQQKSRGTVYALGRERLERGEAVFEAYGVLAAAGVELTTEADALLQTLPMGWRRVCQIDSEGCVWTASVKERMWAGR